MTAALVAGAVAGYAVAIPVGAVAVYLVTFTAQHRACAGVSAALGVAAVDGVYALLAALGGSALVAVLRPIVPVLRWIAAGLLVLIAARIAIAALRTWRGDRTEPVSAPMRPSRAFLAFAGLTAVNPTTVLAFTALVVAQHATLTASVAHVLAFATAAFVASASWQLLLVAGGTALRMAMTRPLARLLTAVVSAAVIVALATGVVLSA